MKLALTIMSAMLFGVLAAACDTDAVEPISPSTARDSQASASLSGNPELFREIASGYWDAFNLYDLEGVEEYYEPSYWLTQEEYIRRNLSVIENLGITLGIEEYAAPTQNDDGEWEMLMLMEEPSGLRVIRMVWIESAAEWLLSFAADVTD